MASRADFLPGRFMLYNSSDESNDDNANEINILPSTVWVFGYGSLCWNPGFEFSNCVTGYVRGYVRRFWQGNTTHRGTKEKPARVATLIEHKEGITFGCAYKISGTAALNYLNNRECKLGGYITIETKFYPRLASENSALSGEAFPALLYIATKENCHWLGEDSLSSIARQIVGSSGPSGHNVEYLIRLAMFVRDELNVVYDDHLFELEKIVKEMLFEQKISLISVMGHAPAPIRRDLHEEVRRPVSFEHASRCPGVKLRCLNI